MSESTEAEQRVAITEEGKQNLTKAELDLFFKVTVNILEQYQLKEQRVAITEEGKQNLTKEELDLFLKVTVNILKQYQLKEQQAAVTGEVLEQKPEASILEEENYKNYFEILSDILEKKFLKEQINNPGSNLNRNIAVSDDELRASISSNGNEVYVLSLSVVLENQSKLFVIKEEGENQKPSEMKIPEGYVLTALNRYIPVVA